MGVARTPARCRTGETRAAKTSVKIHSGDNITVKGKTGRETSANRELLEHEDVNDLINGPLTSESPRRSGLLSNEKSTL